MIVPNKVISLDNSVLGQVVHILEAGPYPISVMELFAEVGSKFESVDQFLLAMDVLFIMDRIDVDFHEQKVIYAA